jgi:hypothetical protein
MRIKNYLTSAHFDGLSQYMDSLVFEIQYMIGSECSILFCRSIAEMLFNLHAEGWKSESIDHFIMVIANGYADIKRGET